MQNVEIILDRLNVAEMKSEGLSSLYDLIVFADERLYRNFNILDKICRVLVTNLMSNDISMCDILKIMQITVFLLNNYSKIIQIFRNYKLFQTVQQLLSKYGNTDIDLISNIFQIVCIFFGSYSQKDDGLINFDILFLTLEKVNVIEKRMFFANLSVLCQKHYMQEVSSCIDSIIEYTQSDDNQTKQYAIKAYVSLIGNSPLEVIGNDYIQYALNLLYLTSDQVIFESIISFLLKCLSNTRVLIFLASNPPDFEIILYNSICLNDRNISRKVFILIQNLIPETRIPKSLWNYSPKESFSPKFVLEIFHVLRRYLLENNENKQLVISTMAACSSVVEVELDDGLVPELITLSSDPKTAVYVLIFCLELRDLRSIWRSGIYFSMDIQTMSNQIGSIYRNKLKLVQPKQVAIPTSIQFSQDINQIIKYIDDQHLYPYEFMNSGLCEKLLKMMNTKINFHHSNITRLLFGALLFYRFPRLQGVNNMSYLKLSKESLRFSVSFESNRIISVSFPVTASFFTIEGWYNKTYNKESVEELKRTNLDVFINAENIHKDYEMFACISRALNVKSYKKLSFKIETFVFSVYDNLIHSLARALPDISSIFSNVIMCHLLMNETPRSQLVIRPFFWQEAQKFLDFLRIIYIKTSESLTNTYFINEVVKNLNSPISSIFLLNPAVHLIYEYSYMFSLEAKLTVTKLISYNTGMSIEFLKEKFKSDSHVLFSPKRIKFLVDRNNIFEEGAKIFTALKGFHVITEFSFKGEKGFGEGPTREFFTLFSHELIKKNIFRDSNELFPTPNANLNLMELVGIFVSHAFINNRLCDLPFSTAFFKLLKNEAVKIEEVDNQLAKSLEDKDGLIGLDFVYPGIPEIELSPDMNKEIDETNVDEYIRLVKNHTCGPQIMDKIAAFAEGFSYNIPFGVFKMFTPEECIKIFNGEPFQSDPSEIIRFIRTEHGYTLNSPEITMFLSVICSFATEEKMLLIRFITGSSRLPSGGFSKLSPHLTIAKKVPSDSSKPDEMLPSVMTCTNYFKLPQYSNKEIMRSKLLMAISECRNSFDFS